MNLFEIYLKKIKEIALKRAKELNINEDFNLESININIEIPPPQFDFDLSCNIAMVLGKKLKENPKNLADKIKDKVNIDVPTIAASLHKMWPGGMRGSME